MNNTDKPITRTSRQRKRYLLIAGGIIALAVLVRIALPPLITGYMNHSLKHIPPYTGHIESVALDIWRLSGTAYGITIRKMCDNTPLPLFSCESIRVTINRHALLRANLLTEIQCFKPVISVITCPTEIPTPPKPPKETWQTMIHALMPLRIDRVDITQGTLHLKNIPDKPDLELVIDDITGFTSNLTNSRHDTARFPAHAQFSASYARTGMIAIQVALDPRREYPTFELKEEIKQIPLPALNSFFDSYAKLKVRKGEFSLYTEIAAGDGKFIGYSKPFVKDLELEKSPREAKTLLRAVWATIVSATDKAFSNQKRDQVATKIPIQGTFEKANVDIITTITNVLKNAFIQALVPSLDNTIHVSDIKNRTSEK